MSNATKPAGATVDDLLAAESNLGQALAVIHRLLPRLEETTGATDVQGAFRRAVACLEAAREAHQRFAESRAARAGIAGETVAAISAAIAVVLGQPFRLVSVQKVPAPVPHLNVWALEGRTQIFQSHKVR